MTLSGCHTAPPSPWLPTVVRLICSWTIVTKGGGGGGAGGITASVEALVALVSLAVSAASCGSGGADGVGGGAGGAGGRLNGWRVALPRRSKGERSPRAASTNASMARGGDGAAMASCTLPSRPWSSSVPRAARPALLCSACAACLAAAAVAAELVAAAVTRAAAVVAAAAAAAAAANSALARRAKPLSTCGRLGRSILQASATPSLSETDPGATVVALPSKGGEGGGGGRCAALTALHSPLSFASAPRPSKWRRSLCDVHTPAMMPASLWLPTTTRAPPMLTASPSAAMRHRKKPLSCLCPTPISAPKRVYLCAAEESVFCSRPRGCHCCHMPTYPRRCTSHTATAMVSASGTATASAPCIAHTCSRRPSLSVHGPERSGPRPAERGEPSGAPSMSPAHRASGVRHATEVPEARAALTVAAPKRHSTAAPASAPKPPPMMVSCVAPRAGPAGLGSCAEIVAGGRHRKSAPLLP